MDRDNKYYEIIENLVRNHKKFAGYETIVEDIIDDVYSHSQIVLNSVANPDVINSYLAKVVSTSMITVPKKMNFNKDINHVNIGTQFSGNKQTEKIIEPAKEEFVSKVNNDYVDKMINMAEVVKEEPIQENEIEDLITFEDLQEGINIESETKLAENKESSEETVDGIQQQAQIEYADIEELFEDKNDENGEEGVFSSYENDTETLDVQEIENEQTVINDANEEVLTNGKPLVLEEQKLEEITEYDVPLEEVNDEVEETTESEMNNDFGFDLLSEDLEEDNTEIEVLPEVAESEGVEAEPLFENSDEDSEEVEEPIEIEETYSDESDLLSQNIEEVEEESILEEDDLPVEALETKDNEDNEEVFTFDESDLLLDDEEETSALEEFSNDAEDNLINFDVDNDGDVIVENGYSGNDVETKELQDDLFKLDAQYPELNIIEICKLKYVENYTIDKIAETLDITEDKVIEVLNKLTDLV